MTSQIIPTPLSDDLTPHDRFNALVEEALKRLRSPRSRRVYRDTYTRWRDWCAERQIDPHALTTDYVEAFLRMGAKTQATVNREMSSLRTLAAAATLRYPAYPEFETLHARLKLLRVHIDETVYKEEGDPAPKRKRKALRGDEVYTVINAWSEDRLLHRRNRALVALLFYTGLRRAEAASLLWEDIDLDAGLVYVAQGKGDKERTVPILGDPAVEALRELRERLPDHPYVFPSMRRGDQPTERPITGNVVYDVVRRTSERSGVEFKPHDARRTVITGIIDNGGSVRDAQAVAGHADASTTMTYAQASGAKKLKERLKVGY